MKKTVADLVMLISSKKLKSRVLDGKYGEDCVEKWLNKSQIKYEKIDQSVKLLPDELKAAGAKRPDFIIERNEKLFLLDAKYHHTNECKVFKLSNDEFKKYKNLKAYCREICFDVSDVIFAVVPQEHHGKKLIQVYLSDFENATDDNLKGKGAKAISLDNYEYEDTGVGFCDLN